MNLKRNIGSLAAVGVLLLVLLNLPPAASSRITGGVRDALTPVAVFLSHTFSFGLRMFQDSGDLAAANSQMAVEIGRLRNEIRQLKSLEHENTELRHLLGLETRSGFRLLAAQVTDRAIGGWWEMARLDQGAANGVALDLPVISNEGLVGRIVDVSAYTSDIILLVDPNSKVSASCPVWMRSVLCADRAFRCGEILYAGWILL